MLLAPFCFCHNTATSLILFSLRYLQSSGRSSADINVDHVATLRQARGCCEPDPIAAAILVELAGADGLVAHLREDRRHIQERDLKLLSAIVQTKLNLEMAAQETVAKIALNVKPDIVTLVPERRQELTTEGGLAVTEQRNRIKTVFERLHDTGIAVSLFIDPDPDQIKAAHKVNADCIELHTGRYANARHAKERQAEFDALAQGAKIASKLGLGVSAGHGLTYHNVKRLTQIPEILEFNIGHSIMARAILVGLDRAAREMKNLVT